MKPLLIIKTGRTVQRLPLDNGDFEDWIRDAMSLQPTQVLVSDVVSGEQLPEPGSLSGVVITGSAAMVTDRLPWSEYTAGWLRELAPGTLPVLGICYGHQLLAHAFGGIVDFHPDGREIGTACISRTEEAANDPLFSGLPENFPAHVSHMQSVLHLPEGACVLACNSFEKHHAVRYNESVWGVQFHPEFDEVVMQAYIEEREKDLLQEGLSPQQLLDSVEQTDSARLLLQNFAKLLITGI